jgi:nitroreductase
MAAYSLGLGTCWVGFAEMLNFTDWPKRLGIEEPYKLIDAITVGFPAGDPQRNVIQRETHKISWFEDGTERALY